MAVSVCSWNHQSYTHLCGMVIMVLYAINYLNACTHFLNFVEDRDLLPVMLADLKKNEH